MSEAQIIGIHDRLDKIENMVYKMAETQENFENARIQRDLEGETEHRIRCEIMEIKRVERELNYKMEQDSSNEDIKCALIDLANTTTNKRGFFNFNP